jgi:hypothetical protein
MPDLPVVVDSSFWYEECIYNYHRIDDDIVIKDDQDEFISARKDGGWVGWEPPLTIKLNISG